MTNKLNEKALEAAEEVYTDAYGFERGKTWTPEPLHKAITAYLNALEPVDLDAAAWETFSIAVGKWRDSKDIVRNNPPMHIEEIKSGLKAVLQAAGVPYKENDDG